MAKKSKYNQQLAINNKSYEDYLYRFRRVCLSMFKWENLPSTMDQNYLEKVLFEFGQAGFTFIEKYGLVNTKVADSGELNIYDYPTKLNCYSHGFNELKTLYTGVSNPNKDDTVILIQNNWDRLPTLATMELFAYRMYEAERTTDVNIKAQKTPVLVICDEKQRLTMENIYHQYDGNKPVIFGDKNSFEDKFTVLKTEAPLVFKDIQEYKKEIWNEALTFLGINNLVVEKKERLVTEETSSNNELINLNLLAMLEPRKKACDEFNKKYGTNISVKVNSDLHNVIKNTQSAFIDKKEVNEDGRIHNND